MGMRAGLLTECIDIYSPSATTNQFGEENNVNVLKAITRARVIHNNGNRTLQNSEVFYSYNKTFQVRIYVNVDEFDLIKYDNKFYRILSLDKNKEEQLITINTELVND